VEWSEVNQQTALLLLPAIHISDLTYPKKARISGTTRAGKKKKGKAGALTSLAGVAVLALDEAPAGAPQDGLPHPHCHRRISRRPASGFVRLGRSAAKLRRR
jgi:hypothetical protein